MAPVQGNRGGRPPAQGQQQRQPQQRPAQGQQQRQPQQRPAQARQIPVNINRPAVQGRAPAQGRPPANQGQQRRQAPAQQHYDDGGFKYQRRTVEQFTAEMNKKSNYFDDIFVSGIDVFKPKNGQNCIRFLPPTWENPEHYALSVWTHEYIGANNGNYLCLDKMLGQRCPICEESQRAGEEGDKEGKKNFAPRDKLIAWVLDRKSDNPTAPVIYKLSRPQNSEIMGVAYDQKRGDVLWVDDVNQGYDLNFSRTSTGADPKNVKYGSWAFDRQPSALSDDPATQAGILKHIQENPLPTLLKYETEEYLDKILIGTAEQTDEMDTSQDHAHEGAEASGVAYGAGDETEVPFEPDAPVEYDADGNPIEYDEAGDVIEYDADGNPIEYDEAGNPIEYVNEMSGEEGDGAGGTDDQWEAEAAAEPSPPQRRAPVRQTQRAATTPAARLTNAPKAAPTPRTAAPKTAVAQRTPAPRNVQQQRTAPGNTPTRRPGPTYRP